MCVVGEVENKCFCVNDHAIYLDVKQYLAAQRTGTHKAKERSDVKGSRRKLRKQKGRTKKSPHKIRSTI